MVREPEKAPVAAGAPLPDWNELSSSERAALRKRQRRLWLALALLLATALGCSAADLFENQTPTPQLTLTLVPTFTSTPERPQEVIIITPPFQGTPGVIIVPPGTNPNDVLPEPSTPMPTTVPTEQAPLATASAVPSATPTSTDTTTPTPTITPTPTPSATPTATSTPYIVVEAGQVALRSGPGVEFPLVAQLGPGIPIAITGQNTEGSWYQLCCINGTTAWVAAAHVVVNNNPHTVALLLAGTPPSPTPTLPPTATGTVTPTPTPSPYPFQRSLFGLTPAIPPTDNRFITIWVKLHRGPLSTGWGCTIEGQNIPNKEVPVEGYYLEVSYQGEPRPSSNGVEASANTFKCASSLSAPKLFEYNLKYEWVPTNLYVRPGAFTPTTDPSVNGGVWRVYVKDSEGRQVSDIVEFTPQSNGTDREVYIAWQQIH